jgi:dTDP-4-amino-4,6-dideoxygalactose transaminase
MNELQPALRIPLMVPELPTLDALTPYLRRIDQNRWYSNFGPLTREFEERLLPTFSASDGVHPHVVTVSTGTAGIELALRALELPPSSAVLVPALTFVATATACTPPASHRSWPISIQNRGC